MIEPNRKGEVWVFAEQEGGALHDVSLELCGKARELADILGVGVGAVLPGSNVSELPGELIAHGADKVYLVDDARLEHYQTGSYARVMTTLVEKHRPQIVIYGATSIGRDLGPRVASTLRAGLTADCTDLEINDVTDSKTKTLHENLLLQIRPAFGGNIIATIVNYDQWPQMATVREGVMPLKDADRSRRGEVVRESVEIGNGEMALKLIQRHVQPRTVNLKGARVIVAGGGGVGSKENFQLIQNLAGAIGGAVGCLAAAALVRFAPLAAWTGAAAVAAPSGSVLAAVFVLCLVTGLLAGALPLPGGPRRLGQGLGARPPRPGPAGALPGGLLLAHPPPGPRSRGAPRRALRSRRVRGLRLLPARAAGRLRAGHRGGRLHPSLRRTGVCQSTVRGAPDQQPAGLLGQVGRLGPRATPAAGRSRLIRSSRTGTASRSGWRPGARGRSASSWT